MSDHRNRPNAKLRFSIGGRLKSFVYAGRGLRWLVQKEHNAWLHLVGSAIVIGAGLVLRISLNDWRWLVFAMALVWMAEAVNTAIEALCDHISPGFDPSIGKIKDLAAGAVLIAAIAAAVIGFLTLGPPLVRWIA